MSLRALNAMTIRNLWAAVGLLLLAAGSFSCARLPVVGEYVSGIFEKNPDVPQEDFALTLEMSRTDLRPGDPLVALVGLTNNTGRAREVQWLDASSLEFYVNGPTGAIKVRPVFSRREMMGETQPITPGQTWRRPFLFTTLTKEPGEYNLQAVYYPMPKGMKSDFAPAIAESESYNVSGPRSVRRDRDGILLKDDAIAVAQRALARPVEEVRAELVMNEEAGFFDWWITLKIDEADLGPDEDPYRAYFVSPYLGTVITNRQARPYVPPEEEKKPTRLIPKAGVIVPLDPETGKPSSPIDPGEAKEPEPVPMPEGGVTLPPARGPVPQPEVTPEPPLEPTPGAPTETAPVEAPPEN